MTSDRPYRSGWPPDRVNALIRDLGGTHLNSRVVEIFLRTIAPYPIGTSVDVVSDDRKGYQGVVVDVDDTILHRPKIRLLFDEAGERIGAIDIDLREQGDVQVISVRGPEPKLEPLGSSVATGWGVIEVAEDDEVAYGDDEEIEFVDEDDEIVFIADEDEESGASPGATKTDSASPAAI